MEDQQQVNEDIVQPDKIENSDSSMFESDTPIDIADDDDSIDISDDNVSFEEESAEPPSEIVAAEVEDELQYPNLPKEQHEAFGKALQREKRKIEEQYQEQLVDHQNAVVMASQYGWDQDQVNMYMQEQQQQRNDFQAEVDWHINKLAESDPTLPGIKGMSKDISQMMWKNPNLNVKQAYHAVAPESAYAQMKREAEQRAIAKRSQTSRTVASDSPITQTGPEALTPEAVAFMKRENMSETKVRQLMGDAPKTLADYRKMTKKGR